MPKATMTQTLHRRGGARPAEARTDSDVPIHSTSSPGAMEYRSAIAVGMVPWSFEVTFDTSLFWQGSVPCELAAPLSAPR